MPTIISADGTRLDVTSTGSGPGLVVIPGGLRRSHHYRQLAESLADSRTVHVIERRGRGDSGPPGRDYSIEREAEDAVAVLDATGSTELFGHSYGGLAGLHVALRRDLRRLVVYEPGVSLDGSLDTTFLDSDGSRYAAIASPTLIIAGGHSPDWLRRVQPRLAELIPHARYVLMPELDHNAPDQSAPATVADLVRAFLTTDDAEAR